jgi:hypothetical protein
VKITKIGFSKEITDSELRYMEYLENAILKHSCVHSEVFIDKRDLELKVTIKPSDEALKGQIINDILASHRLMGIRVIFSKSLAISHNISYSIDLN